MAKPLKVLIQYCCPQHVLTAIVGWLAECRWPWFKNWAIKRLIRKYHVNLSEAASENLADYPHFNSFFTRQLKPGVRPVTQDPQGIASPADGCISQIGKIAHDTLLQAKGFDYTTAALLGDSQTAQLFENGQFATIYLAPKDYHRVHMPLTGKLLATTYIPGQLFSVNQRTAQTVPNLFTRNERLVCLFETAIGPMAVVLVGAMLVGHIETVWPMQHSRNKLTTENYPDSMTLERGAELGLFKMGSTVIVLFGHHRMQWRAGLQTESAVRMGEAIGVSLVSD